MRKFTQRKHSTPTVHHQTYRDHFNAVDRTDARFYEFYFGFKVSNWRTKMTLSVLTIAAVNGWALHQQFQNRSLREFRTETAAELMLWG